MIRHRRLVAALAAALTVTALTTAPAAAAPVTLAEKGVAATRLGQGAPVHASYNVPDDQVVCGVDGWKPTWSPKPTVNFGVKVQCNGRWRSGVAHLYLFYRFSESDSWTLANKEEFIPLPGGDSSTLVMRGLSHTLAPCFPAYWYGQVYVEATFYAGKPITDSAWFGTTRPDPFLSC